MSAEYCGKCKDDILTEADNYLIIPKSTGTFILCELCARKFFNKTHNRIISNLVDRIEKLHIKLNSINEVDKYFQDIGDTNDAKEISIDRTVSDEL